MSMTRSTASISAFPSVLDRRPAEPEPHHRQGVSHSFRQAARITLTGTCVLALAACATSAATAPPVTVIVTVPVTVLVTEPVTTLAPLPDMAAIAKRYIPSLGVIGDARSVTVSTGRLDQRFQDWLVALGFTGATISLMEHTRGIDGIQHAAGRNCVISWTFDGDSITIIAEAKRNT